MWLFNGEEMRLYLAEFQGVQDPWWFAGSGRKLTEGVGRFARSASSSCWDVILS